MQPGDVASLSPADRVDLWPQVVSAANSLRRSLIAGSSSRLPYRAARQMVAIARHISPRNDCSSGKSTDTTGLPQLGIVPSPDRRLRRVVYFGRVAGRE
jgi:hypothetical protein